MSIFRRRREDIIDLYKRLYFSRAAAERLRDYNDGDYAEYAEPFYNRYRNWENICAAAAAGMRPGDTLRASESALSCAYLTAGGHFDALFAYIEAKSRPDGGRFRGGAEALPACSTGAAIRDLPAGLEAAGGAFLPPCENEKGTPFYFIDITDKNIDAAEALLDRRAAEREPLMLAVRVLPHYKAEEERILHIAGRRACARIDAHTYDCPERLLRHMCGLTSYTRGEHMQGLVLLRDCGRNISGRENVRPERGEDALSYLTRIMQDDDRRGAVYAIQERLNAAAARIRPDIRGFFGEPGAIV